MLPCCLNSVCALCLADLVRGRDNDADTNASLTGVTSLCCPLCSRPLDPDVLLPVQDSGAASQPGPQETQEPPPERPSCIVCRDPSTGRRFRHDAVAFCRQCDFTPLCLSAARAHVQHPVTLFQSSAIQRRRGCRLHGGDALVFVCLEPQCQTRLHKRCCLRCCHDRVHRYHRVVTLLDYTARCLAELQQRHTALLACLAAVQRAQAGLDAHAAQLKHAIDAAAQRRIDAIAHEQTQLTAQLNALVRAKRKGLAIWHDDVSSAVAMGERGVVLTLTAGASKDGDDDDGVMLVAHLHDRIVNDPVLKGVLKNSQTGSPEERIDTIRFVDVVPPASLVGRVRNVTGDATRSRVTVLVPVLPLAASSSTLLAPLLLATVHLYDCEGDPCDAGGDEVLAHVTSYSDRHDAIPTTIVTATVSDNGNGSYDVRLAQMPSRCGLYRLNVTVNGSPVSSSASSSSFVVTLHDWSKVQKSPMRIGSKLKSPRGIAAVAVPGERHGGLVHVAVADHFNHRILLVRLCLGSENAPLTVAETTAIGSRGSGPRGFVYPDGIAADAEHHCVWVADGGNDRIHCIDVNTADFAAPPLPAHGSVSAVAVLRDHQQQQGGRRRRRLAVADPDRHEVRIIAIGDDDNDDGGTLLASFGSDGTLPGQFDSPSALVESPHGRRQLFVADRLNNRVQAWSPSADGNTYAFDYILDVECEEPSGLAITPPGSPTTVAGSVASDGQLLLIACSGRVIVCTLQPEHRVVHTFARDAQPWGVACLSPSCVLVSDMVQHAIHLY